jgi:hypothetical protein
MAKKHSNKISLKLITEETQVKVVFDPLIMDELLKEPETKAIIKQWKIKGDHDMALLMAFLVREGIYDRYIKERTDKKEGK